MTPYLSLEHPVRLAHRGSRILWPENTEFAFGGAVDMGYRYIETDVRITADGVVVVFHDATLDRLTNGRGRVDQWRWEDLRHLDAAWSFRPEQGYPLRATGIGIPRLDEVLANWPDTHFNIDLKQNGLEWPVAEVITLGGRRRSVLVGAFSDRRVARFRRITRDEVATAAGPRAALAMWGKAHTRPGSGQAKRRAKRSHFAAFQVPYDRRPFRIDGRFVEAIHSARAQIHVWTVNDPVAMNRLLDVGVDGIVTDRPDLLDKVLLTRAGATGSRPAPDA